MIQRHINNRILAALLVLLAFAPVRAAIPVPDLQGRVTDTAGILSSPTREHIGSLLKSHEDRTKNQVAVLAVPALEGESIEEFATRVFDKWRLGQKGKDNGVLVVISTGDRRMRIEVGYGLEGTLTDLKAGRIIDNIMTPRFKANDYDGGVTAGVLAIIAQLEDPNAQVPAGAEEDSGSFLKGPDLPIMERILFGCFIFGIIGLFTVIGVLTPGVGWFLYFFLIPFWAMFPIIVVGVKGAIVLLITYLVSYPTTKIILSRSTWYKKAQKDLKTKGTATIGGFTFSSSSSGGWSSGSSSGGFSGGGGSSGGGGASGGW